MILGCDPGLTGAFALIDDKGTRLAGVHDMPVKTKRVNGSDRKVLDEDGLHEYLLGNTLLGVRRLVIERVGGLPGQSAPRAFNFGYGYGTLLSTARMLHFDVELVTPQAWKGKLLSTMTRSSDPKKFSLMMATRTFGNEHWKRVKDHGRAEAALIALYGARHIWGEKK